MYEILSLLAFESLIRFDRTKMVAFGRIDYGSPLAPLVVLSQNRMWPTSDHGFSSMVTPAEKLMSSAIDSALEVEALVLNLYMGLVDEGQAAEVKTDTFNFTKCGIVNTSLLQQSTDATSHEQFDLIYQAKVRLDVSRPGYAGD